MLTASDSTAVPAGADHHHVHLGESERLGGARLPLRSQGSHHPVPASEERGVSPGHRQPLQCHGVGLCLGLGSQLQLLQRYHQQFFFFWLVCSRAVREGNFKKPLFCWFVAHKSKPPQAEQLQASHYVPSWLR